MWNGVDPHEFVFHRNHSLSLVISEIQIDLGVYWFTLVPIMDSLYSDSGVRTLDWLLMQWSYVFLALTHWIYVCHYRTAIQGSYWAGWQKSILLTLGLPVNIPTNWVNTMFFYAMAPWITRLSTDMILIIKISLNFFTVIERGFQWYTLFWYRGIIFDWNTCSCPYVLFTKVRTSRACSVISKSTEMMQKVS